MAKKKIDFSGVETFQKAPEGAHVVKVATMEEVSFASGNQGFKVAFELTKGAAKGARVYENFPLADNSLWKLKSLLEAVKIKCDGRILLDTDKVVGKTLEIEVIHEEYNGSMKARVAEMRRLGAGKVEESEDEDDEDEDFDEDDDFDEDEDDEEEVKPAKTAPKKSKTAPKAKKKAKAEESDDEDEKPAKKANKSAKKAPKVEEPEDDDDWDDEDEDWDE